MWVSRVFRNSNLIGVSSVFKWLGLAGLHEVGPGRRQGRPQISETLQAVCSIYRLSIWWPGLACANGDRRYRGRAWPACRYLKSLPVGQLRNTWRFGIRDLDYTRAESSGELGCEPIDVAIPGCLQHSTSSRVWRSFTLSLRFQPDSYQTENPMGKRAHDLLLFLYVTREVGRKYVRYMP